MPASERRCLFGGVAVLSCAMILLHISLARLYSAVFGPHIALLSLSFSALGAGLGGVLLFAVPRLGRPQQLFAQLAYLSCGASGTGVIAIIAIIRKKPPQTLDLAALTHVGLLCLASMLPAILAGIAIAAAVRHAAREISRLYVSDLVGAAAGSIGAAVVLQAGAPRAALIASLITALAAAVFFRASRPPEAAAGQDSERATGGVVATFVLGTTVLLAGDIGTPWLKLPAIAWSPIERVEFQQWNEMALVTVDKPAAGMALVRTDGSAGTSILEAKTQPQPQPDDIGYVLHKDRGPVLVLGAGGGADIRAALKAGQKDIVATEENPTVARDVMRQKYKDYSGAVYDRPEVKVTIESARSYVRRSSTHFRQIILPLHDTEAASAKGALALSTSTVYTVEAFRDFLDRLEPGGTLTVSRFADELDRLLSIAAAALRRHGSTAPSAHLFACGQTKTSSLLIKRSPLDKDEIRLLRNHCKQRKFVEQFSPDAPSAGSRRNMIALASAAGASLFPPVHLTPPTDDRPFFFNSVPARRLPELLGDMQILQGTQWGLLMLVAFLTTSTAVALLVFLVPFFVRRQSVLVAAGGAVRVRALVLFLCLGAGFCFAALSLVHHFSVFLGHPARALAVTLAALFLFGAIGSLLTAPIPLSGAEGPAGRRAAILVIALSLYAAGLSPLLELTGGLPLLARLATGAILIAPLGLLAGTQAPLAVKLVSSHKADILPWCWGVAGAGSAVAAAFGILLALYLGWSAVLLAAGVMYLCAALVMPAAADGSTAAPADPNVLGPPASVSPA